MVLPKVLYIRQEVDGETTYYLAEPVLKDVVGPEDGPYLIGTYWLKEKPAKYRKVVSAV